MRLIGFGFCWLLAASAAQAQLTLQIADTRTQDEALTVDWFIAGAANAGRPREAQLLVDGRVLETAKHRLPPDEELPLCYLFLVDTSESMGKALEKSVQPFLQAVFTARPDRHYYGLARFDSNLKMLAAPSRDDAKLTAALRNIRPQGGRTELYRSVISAVKPLRTCPGYRKLIVLISDGGAEDVAYRVDDAIAAAKEAHIAVVTIGYFDSIKLQNLAKLAEGTGGGHLAIPTAEKALVYGEAKTIFQNTDTGGRSRIEFASLPEFASGAGKLTLRVTAADGKQLEHVLETTLPEVSPGYMAALGRYLPWVSPRAALWIIGLGLFGIGLIAWLALMRGRRPAAGAPRPAGVATPAATVREGVIAPTVGAQRAADMATVRTPAATAGGARVLAQIQHAGGVLDVTSLPCTIGALRDNALQINDESVSRYHAVLDRRDNRFYVTDRGSANGTFVNRSRTQHSELKNGDQLRLGTWEGTFRVAE